MKLTTNSTFREAGIAAAITALLSLYVFWPLRNYLFNPWGAGDMLSTYVAADNWGVIASTTTTHYGFPLGMNLNLVPGVDITENIFAKTINLISGNPYFGTNLLLILSFPLVAFLSVIVLRLVGSRGWVAIALAIAFAFIPYHWGRGLGHLYLATMYSVVTGMILVLLIGTGRFNRMIAQRNKWQLIAVALLVFITAWSGLYYAIFALILMAAALAWRLAQRDTWQQLVANAIPIVSLAALVIIGFIPGLIATINNPAFAILAERMPYESVIFAGILFAALVPAPILPDSVFSFYNTEITDAINAAPPFENRVPTNFGTIVTTIALGLLVWGMFMRYRSDRWKTSTAQLPFITYLLSVSLLFFIPWGLNYIFAATVSAQIRAWNRFLPVVLLLFILAAGVVLKRVRKRHSVALLAVAGIGATFINSVYPFKENYLSSAQAATKPANAARDYSAVINSKIPEYCGVLQLPYMGYPENGPLLDLDDYGHFWLPLNDSGKAWSYGAIKNTEAGNWAAQLPEVPTEPQVANLIQAGFCGIHLDIRGYVKPAAERITEELSSRYGVPIATGNPDVDGNDTWFFYQVVDQVIEPKPINELDRNNQDQFLAPAFTTLLPNSPAMTVAPRGSKGGLIWWWTIQPEANFTLHQINDQFPITRLALGLRSSECESAQVDVFLTDTSGAPISDVLTVSVNPTTTKNVTLTVEPTNEAVLKVISAGNGCDVANFPYQQFVQVIDATTS